MSSPEGLPDAAALGLSDAQREALAALGDAALVAGRVVSESKGELRVWCEGRELAVTLSGRMQGRASGREALPAVGDWVALEVTGDGRGVARALLPRRSAFVRRAAGHGGGAQVVAANVDVVLLVTGLDADFNVRRIERYLAAAWESGAAPVVVLTKADVCDDAAARAAEATAAAGRAPVVVVSALTGDGVEAVRAHLRPGETVAVTGSSGAGKSTLANALAGAEVQRTGAVRAHDHRGRHTTTRRELLVLPGGALLIDTPGMRELQLWDVGEGLDAAFEDVAELAARCRFGDCAHGREPGCAVREALASGALDRARYESWAKLRGEAEATRAERARRQRAIGRARKQVKGRDD